MPIAFQRLQPISRRLSKVIQAIRVVQDLQLSPRNNGDR
jgi:hypothetical protein